MLATTLLPLGEVQHKPFFKKESFTKETMFFSKGFCEAKVLSGNLTPCNGATPKESNIREIRTYGSMRGRRS